MSLSIPFCIDGTFRPLPDSALPWVCRSYWTLFTPAADPACFKYDATHEMWVPALFTTADLATRALQDNPEWYPNATVQTVSVCEPVEIDDSMMWCDALEVAFNPLSLRAYFPPTFRCTADWADGTAEVLTLDDIMLRDSTLEVLASLYHAKIGTTVTHELAYNGRAHFARLS